MATDALELDEEDVHEEHPSNVVSMLMKDEDKVRKLDELNLDEFAVNMYETNGDLKRHTLNVIRSELLQPFGEMQPKFVLPETWDVLTMLTSETQRTLCVGLIVSVSVVRVTAAFTVIRLDSGIKDVINSHYLNEDVTLDPFSVVFKGQTLPGVIIDVKHNLDEDQFSIVSSRRCLSR